MILPARPRLVLHHRSPLPLPLPVRAGREMLFRGAAEASGRQGRPALREGWQARAAGEPELGKGDSNQGRGDCTIALKAVWQKALFLDSFKNNVNENLATWVGILENSINVYLKLFVLKNQQIAFSSFF